MPAPHVWEQAPQADDGTMAYGSARMENTGPATATTEDAASVVTSAYSPTGTSTGMTSTALLFTVAVVDMGPVPTVTLSVPGTT
jgi:hypothetical protein